VKLKIEIDGEVADILRSIDTSLRKLASREPQLLYNKVTSPNIINNLQAPLKSKEKAGIDRLSVASPEEIAKQELIAYCRENNLDIREEDIDIQAMTREY